MNTTTATIPTLHLTADRPHHPHPTQHDVAAVPAAVAASGSSSARCARRRPSSPPPSSSASCCRGSWPRSSRPTRTPTRSSPISQTFIFSTWLTTVLAAIVGTLMFTSEVQHGTLAGAVIAQPARWVIVAAKADDRVVLRAGAWASPAWPPASPAPCSAASTPATPQASPPPSAWGLLLTVDGAAVRARRRHDPQARRDGRLERAGVGVGAGEPDPRVRPADAVPLPALQRRQRPARHPLGRRHRRRPSPPRSAERRTPSSSAATSSPPSPSGPRSCTAETPTDRRSRPTERARTSRGAGSSARSARGASFVAVSYELRTLPSGSRTKNRRTPHGSWVSG